MPEDAVLEAPAESSIDTGTIDTSTDTSTSADTGTPEAIDSGDTPQPGELNELRGKELYRTVKEKLRAAGFTHDELKAVRNAIHIAGEADRAAGGNFEQYEAQRQQYSQLAMEGEESYTPEDLIATVREDRQQLQGILADIQAGAPKLLDEMISDHPESFKSLVPQAMDRLAELDNERFSNYVARSAVSYLQSQGSEVEFAVLNEFLPSVPDFPGKARFVQAIQNVYQTISGLKTIASKQIASPEKPQTNQAPQNGGDLEQREMNVRGSEWNRTSQQVNGTLRDSEMTRTAGTRKVTLTDQEKKEISTGATEEFLIRLGSNTRYAEAMKGYLKSGNQRAYNERAISEGQKLLPSIVARHTNAAIDKRTQAKAAANVAKPAVNGVKPQQTNGNNGNLTQWLSGPPKTVGKEVDFGRTSHTMYAKGEAYCKGDTHLSKWKQKSALMQ